MNTIRETAKSVNQGESVRNALKRASERRRTEQEITDVTFGLEVSEPEFSKNYSNDPIYSPKAEAVRDLEKSILVLKLALLRLDALIGGVSPKNPVKNILLEKRIQVHDIIDSLIREKIRVASSENYPLLTH